MPALQKFKLLASQCTISASPTQSPTTSPVFHLRRHHHHPRRRRRTLRMLLSRTAENIPDPLEDPPENRVRRKLKDLFVSSPSPPLDSERNSPDGGDGGGAHAAVSDGVGMLPANGSISSGNGLGGRRGGALRPVSATFRYRLLRKAWRPVLITIPE